MAERWGSAAYLQPTTPTMPSEHITQQRILLECSTGPVRLWRNNVGLGWCGRSDRATEANLRALAGSLRPGDVVIRNARPLHAGLCLGSSDLIGYRTVDGVAQFVALEVKSATGRPTTEQRAFLDHITHAGGCGGVVRTVDDAHTLLRVP
jgi:hypothetical protein